jgi:hypothetical protein
LPPFRFFISQPDDRIKKPFLWRAIACGECFWSKNPLTGSLRSPPLPHFVGARKGARPERSEPVRGCGAVAEGHESQRFGFSNDPPLKP